MRIYLILISSFILVIGFSLLFIEWTSPPQGLLEESRKYILNAKRVNAHILSSELFNQAQMSYDSALLLWNIENKKIKIFRNYKEMEILLGNAIHSAGLSHAAAIETDRQYWANIQMKYEKVWDLYEYFKMTYSNFPLVESDRKKLVEANLVLDEIQLTLKNRSASEIDQKLSVCENTLNELIDKSESVMKNYFNDFELWESLQINALKYASDHNENVLIIDKLNRECKLYYRSTCLATLPIELGYNWIGDKKQSGDKTTPEGMYRVIKKKSGSDTKFHKALLLNYPNEDDKIRHAYNIKNGIISKNSGIGSDIEIHGLGGKGIDWTDGCIALTNENMDKLYSIISTNTPVVIVGSTKPLGDVLNAR